MPTTTFREPPQLPVAFTQTPADLLNITKNAIGSSRNTLNVLVTIVPSTATFTNFVLPWIHDRNNCAKASSLCAFFRSVSPSSELRDASIECIRLWSEYSQEVIARPEIYILFKAVKDRGERLDPECQYYLDKKLSGMARNGAALPAGPVQQRFQVVTKRLDDIEAEGSKRIRAENGGIWFTFEELEGFPKDALDVLKRGNGEHEGKYKLTFGTVDLDMCMKNCVNPETRRRMFLGNENKCPENVPLFKEMIELRAERALLLGYKSHADLMIRDRLMTAEGATLLLEDLQEKTTPASESSRETLQKVKREHLVSRSYDPTKIDDRLYLWDQRFYMNLVEQEEDVDQTKIAEYFPLHETVRGLLKNFETLFGVVFVELTDESRKILMRKRNETIDAMTWHKDVTVYSVWNEDEIGGEFLGYLYLDLLKREGKRDHACNINFQGGFDRSNGERHYPSTTLVISLQQPTRSKPTLIRHRNIVTMFHELGHGIHALVGQTRFAETSGTRTAKDFVEIPSRMLENFCWDPVILRRISKHYSFLSPNYMSEWENENSGLRPCDKPSLELLEKLVATNRATLAPLTQRQIAFAKFDMAVHSVPTDEAKSLDPGEMYNRIRKECTGLHGPELEGDYGWGWGHSRFSHMFGAYDAGYYTYVIASVYSSDLYETKFAKDPMNGEEGRRYRKMVLGWGGSRPEIEFLEEYLGRKPNGAAFARAIAG